MAARPLTLILESKVFQMLPMCTADSRLEASGVVIAGDHLLVVMDNLAQVARIPLLPRPAFGLGGFVGELTTIGYEDITYDVEAKRYFLLRETKPANHGFESEVVEWDESFARVGTWTLDFRFETENKGFEGIAWVRRGADRWLLALCEGNLCRSGAPGRTPGGGRIQIYRHEPPVWTRHSELALPASLPFEDYAGVALDGENRIGVVSQASSMLWVGEFDPGTWNWKDDGEVYAFPPTQKGNTRYFGIEGLAWLTPRRIVVVSDKAKKDDPPRASETDQSIHIFELP